MATNTVYPWTFDAAFERPTWMIDGTGVLAPTTEVATWQGLTLGFRVTSDVLTSTFRALKPDENKVAVLPTDDGGFTAVDRAGGNNTFTLDPPSRRRPLRQRGDFHVRRYEESVVSQAVDEWDVEIEFVKAANRTDTPSGVDLGGGDIGAVFDWTFDQSFAAAAWSLETRYGQLLTESVDADFLGTGEDGVERFELSMRLTHDQAWVWAASLNRLGGIRVRPIADAANLAVDATADGANTISVISPTPSEVAEGEYVVTEWEMRRLNDAFEAVEAVIATT